MVYNAELAARVRTLIDGRENISERKMFGGVAFMTGSNFFIGVFGDEVMCRVGIQAQHEALSRPGSRPMDITGRPANGFVFVGSPGIESDSDLRGWVEQTYAFASALPPKTKKQTQLKLRRTGRRTLGHP